MSTANEVHVRCGQSDRDRDLLRRFAERYAVMALANLPDDYEARKRVITNAIVAALTNPKGAL